MSEMCGDGVYFFIFYFYGKLYMVIYKSFEKIKFKIFCVLKGLGHQMDLAFGDMYIKI